MSRKVRNVAFALLGAAGLVLKRHYSGPYAGLVHSHAGNFSVSFAVYFVVSHSVPQGRFHRLLTAGLALAAVNLFEATNGFQVMANTYDPLDYLANTAGVALAFCIDQIPFSRPRTRIMSSCDSRSSR
ncbi:MAG: hypothetical protein JNK48_12015 [Bryobacterales bacterium]|nr:hypothetical protein [Bryobacterales bacterium]